MSNQNDFPNPTELNSIIDVDSYKIGHYAQYPFKTRQINSYIEARKGKYPNSQICFFGLQAFLKSLKPITSDDLEEMQELAEPFGGGVNENGWDRILTKHGGNLPIEIQAIPEGTVVPVGTPLVQIVNTDSALPWLPSYLETQLLRAVWYPSTIASNDLHTFKLMREFLEVSADSLETLPFMLHDFGSRGVSSAETAALGGMSHLVYFRGTDTVTANRYARDFYNEPTAGFSIPAAEHSTITSWIGSGGEEAAFKNMLDRYLLPGKVVSVVSDSYDIYNAVENLWGNVFRDRIKDSGGRLVVRPDSGNPMTVVPWILQSLEKNFGSSVNNKGFRVLHPSVRVIQGDGMSHDTIRQLLSIVVGMGFSAENLVFGMGGGLLQSVTRDDYGFAMKTSSALIDGQQVDVFKDPITDPGKRSKKGKQAVHYPNNNVDNNVDAPTNMLRPVWRKGELLMEQSFAEIRERALKF